MVFSGYSGFLLHQSLHVVSLKGPQVYESLIIKCFPLYVRVAFFLCFFTFFVLFSTFSGTLFCVQVITGVVSQFIGVMLFNTLYESTLGLGFNGFVFLVCATIKLIPFTIIWWVRKLKVRNKTFTVMTNFRNKPVVWKFCPLQQMSSELTALA